MNYHEEVASHCCDSFVLIYILEYSRKWLFTRATDNELSTVNIFRLELYLSTQTFRINLTELLLCDVCWMCVGVCVGMCSCVFVCVGCVGSLLSSPL